MKPSSTLVIRPARLHDLGSVLSIERAAFATEEEAELVRALMQDSSAKPLLSLIAFQNDLPVGHILFTHASLQPTSPIRISLLAPLAVVPAAQRQGIGGELIKHGLQMLTVSGIDLVFVLGYPDYYSRYGFEPAGKRGFEATYPIPEGHADAWMVKALRADAVESARGKVICADKLSRPEYWRE